VVERMSFSSFIVWMITVRVTSMFFSFPEFDAPAGKDAWIAMLLSTIPVTLAMWPIVSLWRQSPGKTLAQVIEEKAGKAAGAVLNLFLALYFLIAAAISLWELDEVLVTTVLSRTPSVAVSGAMVVVVIVAVRQGIETISRTAVFLAGGGILAVGFLSLLLLPEVRTAHVLPIFPVDARHLATSVVYHASLADLLIVVAFLLPYTTLRPKEVRFFFATPLIANSIIAAAMVLIVAVLSFPLADSFNFEYLSLIREASLGRFLERFDPLVLTGWTVLGYLRISALLLCSLISLATVFGLSDYRPLSIPMGIILLTLALVVFDTFPEREFFVTGGGMVLNLIVCYLLPAAVWLLSLAKKKGGAPSRATANQV